MFLSAPSIGNRQNRVFVGQSTLQSLTCLTQKVEMWNIVGYREKAPRQTMTEFSQGLRRCQKPIAQDQIICAARNDMTDDRERLLRVFRKCP